MPTLLTKDHVKIFKGKYFLPWFQKQEVVHFKVLNKVIVFDLDETLGSFADLYILWRGIKQVSPSYSAFYELCDAFPEFLRYGIITILEYLYDKKVKKECHKMFIYTNNQCSSEWVNLISKYLESKVKSNRIQPDETCELFDKTICAFKINNKQVETHRTGHGKKVNDFIRCALVSEHADICFVDDTEFPLMKSTKVYYICPRPYIHTLSTNTIIKRITQLSSIPSGILQNTSFWSDWFQLHSRNYTRRSSKTDIELDLQVSQKIIYHLRDFMMFGVKQEIGEKKRSKRKKDVRGGGITRTKKLKN